MCAIPLTLLSHRRSTTVSLETYPLYSRVSLMIGVWCGRVRFEVPSFEKEQFQCNLETIETNANKSPAFLAIDDVHVN